MHACMRACIHVWQTRHRHTHTHFFIYAHTYIYINCIYIYALIYIYIYICTQVNIYNYSTLPMSIPSPGCVSSYLQPRWCHAPGLWSNPYPVSSGTTPGFWMRFTNSVSLDGNGNQTPAYSISLAFLLQLSQEREVYHIYWGNNINHVYKHRHKNIIRLGFRFSNTYVYICI